MQCLGDLVETELVRRRWPPQQRDEAVELRAHRLQTAQSWRELLYPARLRSLIEKLPDYHQHFGEVLTSGPDAASLTRLRSRLDSRHQGLQTQMQAQVGVAVAHAFRRSCEVQARRRDLSTLGFCGVRPGPAGYANLLGGADRGQLHTPGNFLQTCQQFRCVGHNLSVEDGRRQGSLQWLARCLRRSIIGQSETCRNASVS